MWSYGKSGRACTTTTAFDRHDVAGWTTAVAALMFAGPALIFVGVATLTAAL